MALTNRSPSQHTWGVSPWWALGFVVIAAGFASWALVTLDLDDRVAGWGACLVFLAAAVAALRFRRRLSADLHGITVRRLVGQRQVPWTQVHDVSVPTLRRRGIISTALEIEFTDDTLVLLRRSELGTDPSEVRTALLSLKK